MILQNKILPIALVAALLGGTVGALVMRHNNNASDTQVASSNLLPANSQANTTDAAKLPDNSTLPATNADAQNSANVPDQNAYRSGFTDGFDTAKNKNNVATRNRVVTRVVPERVVYRGSRRTVARNSRTAYYDYAPHRRSFWQKHQDKLTVAMGTGGGALLGGLIGGHKGAAIGALAGGGGSALYTYKIRKRNRRY
jgi:phage tail tape-measure protein